MPRVHTQKAGKDYPDHGIKKGETYYWWKFRHGGKRKSKIYPKASQLTQSEYLSTLYALTERSEPSFDEIEEVIENIKSDLENLKDEVDGKISNMEQAFPNGCPVLETLQERSEALDAAIADIDAISIEDREDDVTGIWEEIDQAISQAII